MWGGTSLNSGSESGGGHKHIFVLHSEKWGGAHAPLAPPPSSYASAYNIGVTVGSLKKWHRKKRHRKKGHKEKMAQEKMAPSVD